MLTGILLRKQGKKRTRSLFLFASALLLITGIIFLVL
jgi:hypothetical protein